MGETTGAVATMASTMASTMATTVESLNVTTTVMEIATTLAGNSTNASLTTAVARMPSCNSQTEVWVQVIGALLFFLVWPFVVLDMKWFPLGRPAAALVGATFMVIFNIVGQIEVYAIEGAMGNLQALFLLIGMMLLSYYFDREGLLRLVGLWVFGKSKDIKFRYVLWRVCVLSAILAAFITNDATSLVLSPLFLKEFLKQGRPKRELLPLCLGIATSANIGSSSTIFGNPQNAFIASAASSVSLVDFFIALLPSAIVGMCISIGLLYLIFIRELFFQHDDDDEEAQKENVEMRPYGGGTLAAERESIALSYDQSQDPYHTSRIAAEREIMYSNEHLSTSGSMNRMPKSRSRNSLKPSASNPVPSSQSVPEIKVVADNDTQIENGLRAHAEIRKAGEAQDERKQAAKHTTDEEEEEEEDFVQIKPFKERTWRELCFLVWLLVASVCMVILLTIPPPPTVPVIFNLGLIPLGTGIMTMFVDTIFNRKYAFDAMQRIDWTVILMFMGLFTWLGGFQNTCIPEILVDNLAPYMNLNTVGGVLLFTVIVALGSNIFSNVPLVILIVDRIGELCGDAPCRGPLPALLLGWVSTIAGNFTLIGSITNLIVAEKARSVANYQLTFLRYIRFGIVSTFCVLFGCLPIVYFLGSVA
jgi:Na+/H+ antiporter NhaD/arsenite permease-like protein